MTTKSRGKPRDMTPAFYRTARLFHIGDKPGLFCAGRIWIDVTDKVIAEWERRRVRPLTKKERSS